MTQFLFCALVAGGLYFCNAHSMSFYYAQSYCCGQLKQYKYSVCYWNKCYNHRNYWIYHPINYENMGLCKRINNMYYSLKYFTLPNPLPGYCTCKAEATGCFLVPTTAEPTVSSGPETAEPTASPGPETEEPTASPGPETEEPTASSGPETEEPTTSPGPETEEPTTSPRPETEEPTTSPGPETEEPTASPGPETEEPTSSPGSETEEPTPVTDPDTSEPTAETTTVEVPTTTAQPATTTPSSVCPTPPADFSGRVLGGTSIDECTISAVLTFWVDNRQTCNGVLGYEASSQIKVVFLTEFCALYLQYAVAVNGAPAFGYFKGADFPVTLQTEFTILPNHLAVMEPPGTLSQAECTPAAACLYDPATMSDIIDFGSCYITSYGSSLIVGEMLVSTGSLNRADVTKQATCSTRSTTQDEATEPECFVAVNPNIRNCWGDNGAPVFCHLTGSGEEVLYGLVDVIRAEYAMNSENTCATSEFHVIPIS